MRNFLLLTFAMLLLTACAVEEATWDFDLQGHRGARGLLPENTIPSFLIAIDHGVDTIEFDLVVTADRQILISHEPWFHHHISTKPDGTPVTEDEQMEFNIFEMTYEETRQFDVGKRGHVNFPNQQPLEIRKPLMRDAIRAIEAYTQELDLPPVAYNIETKSNPELYGVMYPQPEEFAQLLYDELTMLHKEFDLFDRIIIQSFDPATLIEFRKLNEEIDQAILVFDETTMDQFIDILGYTPEIWSPNYNLVTESMVQEAHQRGMTVIPWTINTVAEMRRQLEMGVDGIITDYPDSATVLRPVP
ncbi:MAG: glycerophosphodiester phosphodiesterase [Balneolaceae bacterium]|nr:MAG: glycerophosphodiester phosphodiesterase [Balneolaceae bacterium]